MRTKEIITRFTKDGNKWLCWDNNSSQGNYLASSLKELLPELQNKYPHCKIVRKKNTFNCYFNYTCDDGKVVQGKDVVEVFKSK